VLLLACYCGRVSVCRTAAERVLTRSTALLQCQLIGNEVEAASCLSERGPAYMSVSKEETSSISTQREARKEHNALFSSALLAQ
jgi:hypothetical protein